MDDRSFEYFGSWSAFGAGLTSLGFALVVILDRWSSGALDPASWRGVLATLSYDPLASALLAAQGLCMTAAMTALFWRLRGTGRAWALWAGGLGFMGGVLSAARGVGDLVAGPQLVAQWQGGDPARMGALKVLSYLPTAVDPRGLGSLLLIGLAVFVASRLALSELAAPPERRLGYAGIGLVGTAYSTALILLFAMGLIGLEAPRAPLGALTFLLLAPAFWILVFRGLRAGVPPRDVPRMSLS